MLRSFACPLALLVLALGSLAAPAEGADRRFYVSAKLGTTDVDGSLSDNFQQVVDGDEDSRGFELGYRFFKFLGIQAGYHDFGQVPGFGQPCGPGDDLCPERLLPTEADTTAYSIVVVPRLPLIGSLSLFGKVGFARWESEVRAAFEGDGEPFGDFADEDLIYGAGLRAGLIGPLSIYGEYEKIGDLIETIAFGATLTF
ncbi:MAG TPA: outer membrane beta-barrel protein [Thermoanaerobaculia bacterium]|nr:outer membrane beta-barrel protein [Thermoanaerobaculia bacterium]